MSKKTAYDKPPKCKNCKSSKAVNYVGMMGFGKFKSYRCERCYGMIYVKGEKPKRVRPTRTMRGKMYLMVLEMDLD